MRISITFYQESNQMNEALKKDVTNRLKSVEGHVRGIQRMVDEDVYCMDILKQIKAVQQALERVSALTCLGFRMFL